LLQIRRRPPEPHRLPATSRCSSARPHVYPETGYSEYLATEPSVPCVQVLAGGIAECGALFGDARRIEHLSGVEYLLLGRLEDRSHAPDDAHRQDYIRVLAALEEIAQDVVGDASDEGDDLAGLTDVATPSP
jgi:hypothetical protein